jgi:hypothetical protein
MPSRGLLGGWLAVVLLRAAPAVWASPPEIPPEWQCRIDAKQVS